MPLSPLPAVERQQRMASCVVFFEKKESVASLRTNLRGGKGGGGVLRKADGESHQSVVCSRRHARQPLAPRVASRPLLSAAVQMLLTTRI